MKLHNLAEVEEEHLQGKKGCFLFLVHYAVLILLRTSWSFNSTESKDQHSQHCAFTQVSFQEIKQCKNKHCLVGIIPSEDIYEKRGWKVNYDSKDQHYCPERFCAVQHNTYTQSHLVCSMCVYNTPLSTRVIHTL